MLLSTTILPSLVVIVKRSVGIWAKLLTGGQKLAYSLRMDLDGELGKRFYMLNSSIRGSRSLHWVLRIPIKLNLYCYYIMYYRSHYIISYL